MGQHDATQLFAIDSVRIVQHCCSIQNQPHLHCRAALQHDAQRVSGHVTVGAAGHLQRERFAADIDSGLLSHRDFGELDHPGGGDAVLLVIYAEALAGHDADAQDIAPLLRKRGNRFDHAIVHVLVRADFDRLVIAVIVNDTPVRGPAVFGDEDIQESVGNTILQLVEPEVFCISPPGRVQIRGIQHQRHLGAPLVNILVLQVLGVGQNIHLAEDRIGRGDVVVRTAGDNGPPSPPGDIGKADMVTGSETAEEEGYPERKRLGDIGGKFLAQLPQVGRIEPEGQRLFFNHEEVGLEGIGHKQQAAAVHSPADVIQPAVAGIIQLHRLFRLLQCRAVEALPLRLIRIEAQTEQADQQLRHFRMVIKSTLDSIQTEPLRLGMGQACVTESDKGIDQRRVLSGQQPFHDIIPVNGRRGGNDLGRAQLPLEPRGQLAVRVDLLPRPAADIERPQEIGMDAVGDRLAIGPADADFESVENLQQLQQEILLGWIADGKQHPGFDTAFALYPGDIQEQSARGIAPVKQPDQVGGSRRW